MLFSRIRWRAMVTMPPNCKFSGSNGKLPPDSKFSNKAKEPTSVPSRVWRWRRKLFHLWLVLIVVIGIIWLLVGFSSSPVIGDVESPEICEEVLMEYLNVSKNQLNGFPSPVGEWNQVHCAKKDGFLKRHVSAMEDTEPGDRCPIPYEGFVHKYGLSMLENRMRSLATQCKSFNIGKGVLGATGKGNHKHYETTSSLCLAKRCWWAIILAILSCKIPALCLKSRSNQMQKAVHLEATTQPQRRFLLQQIQPQQAPGPTKGAAKWQKKLLKLFILFGIMMSIWLFWHLNEKISSRREETLANMCEERARMLQDQFNVSMNHVHAFAILVSTFHHGKQPSAIDQKTFSEYTERTAFERPLTSSVAYSLKVLHSEREQFEKKHGWTIKKHGWATKEMDSEDQAVVQDCNTRNLDPVPVQDEYAPVIFSQETVSYIISIDMMSGKEDRENILRARASGKGVLTSPFKLLKTNNLGVILTFAVYDRDLPPDATPEQRTDATVGYLGASYDFPSLVEKLLQQLASKQTIVVNVYDTTSKSVPIKMYGDDDIIDTGLLHVSNVDFGDPLRKYEMHCRFKLKPPLPWTAINASVGVLVITLLVGHIFQAAINRIAKVEEDYQEMMELKSRAEAADVTKSQFLATVSHEIRTPMNGVLGMLQMLMDTDLDANQQDYAQTALASGKDLISLINEVLDQAKIESGRLELEHVPFDLREVLDKVLSLFSGRSNEKQIELAVYVSDKVPEVVVGDPGRFRQIITNLVGNSIKFTHRGHIFVSVHLTEEVQSHPRGRDEVLRHRVNSVESISQRSHDTLSGFPVVDRWKSWEKFKKFNSINHYHRNEENGPVEVLVTVEDTGIGIPLDAQGRIFTPFMQADSSTSRKYGGTGIGLSISKCLVDLMHGEIGFMSEPNCGSTFSFTVPFMKCRTNCLDVKLHDCNSHVSEFRGLRALVIDNRIIRAEVTRYHLCRLGIYVDIAQSFNSASTYLSQYGEKSKPSGYAMVFVHKDDWDANSAAGINLLLRGSQKKSSKEVSVDPPKIFLLATSIDPSERIRLKSDGFVDNVLMMPLRLSVLVAFFQDALGNGKKKLGSRKRSSTLGSLLKEKRILVVDDNIVNRRVAEGALKKYGVIVICVDSGKVAIEMLRPPHNFDACFMDIQMPGLDGFEATQIIRSIERDVNEKILSGEAPAEMFGNVGGWRTPILAMTADVIQASNEQCIKCGMDDYVSKPFEEEQLYLAVARFFESS